MQHRYKTFREHGVRDIQSYNNKMRKSPMKYIAVIIDEYSELMEDDNAQRELERLSALSRASGISLLISTQRPDSKVISSRIKCNVSVIAGLKTNTAINSRIIMDDDSLSNLRGRGHCIFRYGGKDTELQGMFISDKEITQLIKPYEIDKSKLVDSEPKVEENLITDYTDMEVFQ
jgi:S-DNA-T family DNA segregation ATPase FtsK/SpoIIIE